MRYLLFAGDGYYPRAAWLDLRKSSDDLEAIKLEGRQILERESLDWYQIIAVEDSVELIVSEGQAHGGLDND